ncbi:glycoside hydrolase family 19 protein [bacterium]|nr:glycoside hydrolase family 19 protein [bacterium]
MADAKDIDLATLKKCLPKAKEANLAKFIEGINETFDTFDMTNPQRQAMFLAQTAHESGNFKFTEENLNYSGSALMRVWPRHYPTKEIAAVYNRNKEMIGNRSYGGRMGNGDEASGEGWKYRGRGIIQLTGKNNYRACSEALGIDLIENPEIAKDNPVAVLSAGWFWETRRLNRWCDKGDVKKVTRLINGGTNGLKDREQHYNHILHVLS